MSATVKAFYENGVFRPATTLPLQEHASVRLVVHSFDGTPFGKRAPAIAQLDLTIFSGASIRLLVYTRGASFLSLPDR
jgi:hypothetical protein